MAEVVNLRRARKQRDRAVKETLAAANRQLHGQTKAEKSAVRSELERRDALLDGVRRGD